MWKVNGRHTPSDGKSSHCLWQGELKINNPETATGYIGHKIQNKDIQKIQHRH
jgi:hypothetical protein